MINCAYCNNYYFKQRGQRCISCYSTFCNKCTHKLKLCDKYEAKICHECRNKCYILCNYCNKHCGDLCFDCIEYKCLECNKCKCNKTYLHLLPKDIQNIINEMIKND